LQRPERGGAIFLQNIVCHIFSGKAVPKASAGHLRSVSASGATTENRRALRATTVFRRQSARQLCGSPSAGDKKAGGDIADKQVPENKRMKEKYRLSLAC